MDQRQEVINKALSNINAIDSFFKAKPKRINPKYIEEITNLLDTIKEKIQFYSLENIAYISNFTDNIVANYLSINHHDDYDFLNEEIPKILQELGVISNFSFEENYIDEPDPEKIISLITIVKNKFLMENVDFPPKTLPYLEKIFSSDTPLDPYVQDDIYTSFVKIFNKFRSNDKTIRKMAVQDLIDAYTNIRSIYLDKQENEIIHNAEDLNKSTKKIKENLGLAENEKLITVFNHQSEKYNSTIQNYTYIIIFVFIVIASSILLKLLVNTGSHEISNMIIFGSYILSLSGLLTYLIKERTRLITLQTYCIKCYLELSALPNYLADLKEEQAQSLKIELSKIYFKGHVNDDTKLNTKAELTNATELIEKLTKIITDIKNIPTK